MLQVLYKLKTAKVFDRNRSKEDKGSNEVSDEDPFAIQIMSWCPESRMLCVAGVSANVIIYRFSKLEVTTEVVQVGNILRSELNSAFSNTIKGKGSRCFSWTRIMYCSSALRINLAFVCCYLPSLSPLFQDVETHAHNTHACTQRSA